MYTHTHTHTKYAHAYVAHSLTTHTRTHAHTQCRVMPLCVLAMQSPPQLAPWSSLERRCRRPCVVLKQEHRQRPEGRLAVLQTLPTPRTERTIGHCFRVSCHSNQSRLQVAIARRRTRRVEGRTLQRGVSDGTSDDHGNKQNRQAGNAWHADCPHEGC